MKNTINRFLAAVFSVVIILTVVPSAAAGAAATGDVNGDGEINSSDALLILQHSVGLIKLSNAEITLADVNTDGAVNSGDALEVLSYTVGLISGFSGKNSVTSSEALETYKKAIKKARAERPEYAYTQDSNVKDINVKMSGLGAGLAGGTAKELEDELKKSGDNHFSTMISKGSVNSANCLPSECNVNDPSKFKSITGTVTAEGKIKIDIRFNKEKNPGADSVIVNALGVLTYDQSKQELVESLEDEDLKELGIEAKLNELSYDNCYISCVIDPVNGEFVSLEWNIEMRTDSTVSAGLLITTNQAFTECVKSSHTNFTY